MPTPVIPSPEACATPTAERLLILAWIRDHASRLPAHPVRAWASTKAMKASITRAA